MKQYNNSKIIVLFFASCMLPILTLASWQKPQHSLLLKDLFLNTLRSDSPIPLPLDMATITDHDSDTKSFDEEYIKRLLRPLGNFPGFVDGLAAMVARSGNRNIGEGITWNIIDWLKRIELGDLEATAEGLELLQRHYEIDPDSYEPDDTFVASPGRGPERDQTGEWDGCKMDYDTLVIPLMDRIASLLHSFICDRNYTGVPCDYVSDCLTECCSRPPFPPPIACVELCARSTVCSIIGPPREPRNHTDWSRQMIDAVGKLPTGISGGRTHWPGSFELCERVQADYNYTNETYWEVRPTIITEHRVFTGKYCRVDIMESSPVPLVLGICVPDTCNRDDIQRYIMDENPLFSLLLSSTNISYVYCGQQDFYNFDTDTGAQACVGIVVSIFILVVLATIYDSCLRKMFMKRKLHHLVEDAEIYNAGKVDPDYVKKCNKVGIVDRLELFFVGFSAYSNCRRIWTSRTKKGELKSLNGIRALSYWYIILGGSYIYGPLYNECFLPSNLVPALLHYPRQFLFQIIVNYAIAIDSFFLISGILTTYCWLRRYSERQMKISDHVIAVVYHIVHSYWKIMPAHMLVLMLYAATYRYAGEGPMFPPWAQDAENCRVNWWTNLLMVHNLVNTDTLCLSWTWYVSCIFQLYIASLVVLIPLTILPKLGYFLILVLYSTHLGVTAYVADKTFRDPGAYVDEYFFTPWCRAGPFIIGLVYGIIIYNWKADRKMSWFVVAIGWLVAICFIITVPFVSYEQYREGSEELWTRSESVAYDTLARSAWGLGVGWMVLACSTGYAGFLGRFLTWKAFRPLSKLSFPSFLIHPMMVFTYQYGRYDLLYITNLNVVYFFFGHIWLVGLGGFLFVALLCHYPISVGWERAVMCKDKLRSIAAGRHSAELLAKLTIKWGTKPKTKYE